MRSATARSSSGTFVGDRTGSVTVFRGVPYARPPVGSLRFASPQRPAEWRGTRDATRFGPVALQPGVTGSSEDCLYANVWTPDVAGRRPVLIYIHGGAWMVGAGSLAAYDGARLASRGDVVVVTFNYRLGVLGFGLHEGLVDPLTGSIANWGLQDQASLVGWVHENAPAFGGDPDNISVAGTSAGGASTWQLALLPELRGIISRIVPISACHVWSPATTMTPRDARTAYEILAGELGSTVSGLREVPASALVDGWERIFSGAPSARVVRSGREYRGPVVDGLWMHGFDHDQATPDVPMLVILTRTEGAFYTGPFSPQPFAPPSPTDEIELHRVVRMVLEKGRADVDDEFVEGCIDAYREAAAVDGLPADPRSIWTEVWGDGLFRYQIMRLADRHAREGRTPQYVMEFAVPVQPPYFGTPHESTSPFLFGTHDDRSALLETWGFPTDTALFPSGPAATAVSDTLIDLVASFARDGRPSCVGAPVWPVHACNSPTTMILGEDRSARIATTSKLRQLRFWDDASWVPSPGDQAAVTSGG